MSSAFRALLILFCLGASAFLSAQEPPKPEDVLKSALAADSAAKTAFPKVHGPLRDALLSPPSLSRPSTTSPEAPAGLLAVTVRSTNAAAVLTYLSSLRRQPANVLDTVVEAYLSPSDVAALAAQPFVVSLEAVERSRPRAVSQGRQVHNAQNWITGGFTGAGVKVGIIDDFDGVLALIGSELPSSIVGRCYTSIGVWSGNLAACDSESNHGTAVAESLVDIAPGAQLYISNPITKIDFANTIDWLTSQGVTVINYSAARVWEGPGDGTSPFADSPLRSVDAAVAGGATFVTAAGNEGQASWFGPWTDTNANDLHEFSSAPGSVFNDVFLAAGKTIEVQLRWQDSWTAASRDLDLLIWDVAASTIVASSERGQAGVFGQTPFEYVQFTAPSTGLYSVVVSRFGGVPPSWLQVQAFTSQPLLFATPGGSIGNPAESANPGVLAVGAAAWNTPSIIESYSSRGPTPDGRVKPDIVGVDGADTVTYGTGPNAFIGTSQASPHVAGLAALVKGAFPGASPSQVAAYLKQFAQPRGPSPNMTWGYGLAYLADLCEFTIAPGSAPVGAQGGEVQFSVTAQAGCTWDVSSQATWLTVVSGASGTGSGIVRIQVAANGGPQRTGSLSIAGATVSVTQAASDGLAAPQDLAVTTAGNLVTFTWTASPGAEAYLLQAGSQRGASNLASILLGPATRFQVGAPNGTFHVRVRAVRGATTSGPSNEVELVVGPQRPGPVGTLTSTISGNVVAFSWAPPSTGGAPTHYLLEAGSQSGFTNIASVRVTGTSLVVPGVPPGIYHVRVRAANGAGVGPASNEVTASVAPPQAPHTPTNLTANVSGRSVHISWAPATTGGAPTRYLLLVSSPAGVAIATFPTTMPFLGAASAPPGVYHVRVVAVNSAGTSAPTAEIIVVVVGS